MIRKRSRAREVALQLLFQHELNPEIVRPLIEAFANERLKDASAEAFALQLFDGVLAQRDELDRLIGDAARNWRAGRMPIVDRNALRIGVFELLHAAETPATVAINEAIELARRFGSVDSPGFVNGVLDQVRRRSTRTDG